LRIADTEKAACLKKPIKAKKALWAKKAFPRLKRGALVLVNGDALTSAAPERSFRDAGLVRALASAWAPS